MKPVSCYYFLLRRLRVGLDVPIENIPPAEGAADPAENEVTPVKQHQILYIKTWKTTWINRFVYLWKRYLFTNFDCVPTVMVCAFGMTGDREMDSYLRLKRLPY